MKPTTKMTPMQTYALRKTNIAKLVEAVSGQQQLGRLTATPPSYFSQIVNGERNLGHTVAARIESALRLPPGWVDSPDAVIPEHVTTLAGGNRSAATSRAAMLQAGEASTLSDALRGYSQAVASMAEAQTELERLQPNAMATLTRYLVEQMEKHPEVASVNGDVSAGVVSAYTPKGVKQTYVVLAEPETGVSTQRWRVKLPELVGQPGVQLLVVAATVAAPLLVPVNTEQCGLIVSTLPPGTRIAVLSVTADRIALSGVRLTEQAGDCNALV